MRTEPGLGPALPYFSGLIFSGLFLSFAMSVSTMSSQNLNQLLAQFEVPIASVNPDLLRLALIDISSSAQVNNEKLEFLGDAALRLAAAEFLMERYEGMVLGDMSAVRSHIVSDRVLATIAKHYRLGDYLQLSKSAQGDKAGSDSRLADALEAIMGAFYLSAGNLSLIRPWLDGHLARLTDELQGDPAKQNYKAALQELTQAYDKALPSYEVVEISQVHGDEERFQAQVRFKEKWWGEGKGRSRKMAEQAAAKIALAKLKKAIDNRTLLDCGDA